MSTVHVRARLAPASDGSLTTTTSFARWALDKLNGSPSLNRAAMLAQRTVAEIRGLRDCGPEAWASRTPDPMVQPLRDLFEIDVLRLIREAKSGDDAALQAFLTFAERVIRSAIQAGWFDEELRAEAKEIG